ncbi:MAG: acyl-CoA dehydratase activase-related protein [Symbiobacteriia bacterium]
MTQTSLVPQAVAAPAPRAPRVPPPPPGLARRPKVGVVLAFTGHYDSVRLLYRFLHHAGCDVVASQASTAPIIEAGTALASADFCFPIRVYVGHVHALVQQHPDLDAILSPNLWRERQGTATCAKYRDVGGIAIRSLAGVLPYLRGVADAGGAKAAGAAGGDEPSHSGNGKRPLPRFVRPTIQSLDYEAMRGVAFDVYREVAGLPAAARLGFFLPSHLRPRWAPHLAHVEAAFARAWQERAERPEPDPARLLADESRPRLAVVGRRYLVNDFALTADLKPWFQRRGAVVLTAADVPWEELAPLHQAAEGYYDTHREGQSFIDWAHDRVDGFIVLGSFGCHPDAFQVDYLAEHARALGKPAWTFRFDETVGTAGFQTRFETIYGFLEQQRDRRLAGTGASADAARASLRPGSTATAPPPAVAAQPLRPLFIWPYMGEELNLALDEALVQLGLRHLAYPPKPIDGNTLQVGNRRYSESCSPFAAATGSLMETARDAVAAVRREAAAQGRQPEPRRILALMLRGEGPCTFGWYSIAQNHHLPTDLAEELAPDGHTFELMAMGLENGIDFLRQLGSLGDARLLTPVLAYIEARLTGNWARLSPVARLRLQLGLQLAIRTFSRVVFAKLDAAESVRARSLLIRAHELTPGVTTAAHKECLELLRQAHTPATIRQARDRALARLAAVPQDGKRKPRVASIGEIYVALTSFANRGVVENLLGREGVEVVEGISVSGFARSSLWHMKRRALANHPFIRPLRLWLEARNIHWLGQRPRDLRARPWLEWEIGGEGMPGLGAARTLVEQGCNGILHTYPFKCMPEGIAKDAYKELCDLYGIRYLSLSFDKELDSERVRTEVSTFAALLHAQQGTSGWLAALRQRRQRVAISRRVFGLYRRSQRPARLL